LQTTDKIIPPAQKDRSRTNVDDDDDDDEEEADEPPVETKLVEQVATFDEVMIWGHESTADATENPYSKGLGEWISFAEAVSALICHLQTDI
jgi:ribonuclease H2 subunit C